jgi:hypothetical protein
MDGATYFHRGAPSSSIPPPPADALVFRFFAATPRTAGNAANGAPRIIGIRDAPIIQHNCKSQHEEKFAQQLVDIPDGAGVTECCGGGEEDDPLLLASDNSPNEALRRIPR